MKKNRLFVLGLVTVFVALVSLTFVSSTWAKYTTSATGSDQARVAYWGFKDTSSITLDDLFEDSYSNVHDHTTDLIAPGTEGSATFAFKYTEKAKDTAVTAPEVAYRVTVSVDGSFCDTAIANNANIKWYLHCSDGTDLDDLDWGTLLAEIKNLSGDASGVKQYAANTKCEKLFDKTYTVGWSWAFSTDPSADSVDTTLGNSQDDLDVKLVITINAEQVG